MIANMYTFVKIINHPWPCMTCSEPYRYLAQNDDGAVFQLLHKSCWLYRAALPEGDVDNALNGLKL